METALRQASGGGNRSPTEADAEVDQSALHYRFLVESVGAIVWRGDAATFHFSFVSKEAETLLGYPVERWTAEPTFWVDHIHPDDRAWAPTFCTTAAADLRPHEFEYRMLAADGRVVWLRDIVRVVAEHGRPRELIGVMVDITERKQAEAALHERERQYRTIFEATGDGLVINDIETGLVLAANPAFCQMHGYDDGMVGLHPRAFVHPDSYHLFEAFVEAARHGSEFRAQAQDVRRDGTVLDVEVLGRGLTYQGRPAVLGVVRDVTERVHAYQLLEARVAERTREIERRRQVAEGLRDLLAAVNSRRTLDEVLDAVVAQTGRLLGSDAGAIYLPDGPPSDGLLAARAAQGLEPEAVTRKLHVGRPMTGLAFSMRRPVVASDLLAIIPDDHVHIPEPELAEHVGYVEVLREPAHLDPVGTASVRRLAASYRAILAVPLVARDDTYGVLTLYFRRPRAFDDEEVRLATAFADQAALALENARLSEQAQQAAALEERQRLARELHDAVTQTLFSTALIADVLPDLWDLDQVEARRSLENLRRLTRGALAEMRTLLVELRPGALVELPLGDLLRQLAEATAGRSRVEVTARVEGEQQRPLPPEVQVALYRIAQEALSNAVKHAQARHAALILHQWATGGLSLAIEDDGRGFDATSIPAGHLGVGIMRERAAAVGAGFSIESSPGQGTRVSVQWRGDQAETA